MCCVAGAGTTSRAAYRNRNERGNRNNYGCRVCFRLHAHTARAVAVASRSLRPSRSTLLGRTAQNDRGLTRFGVAARPS